MYNSLTIILYKKYIRVSDTYRNKQKVLIKLLEGWIQYFSKPTFLKVQCFNCRIYEIKLSNGRDIKKCLL